MTDLRWHPQPRCLLHGCTWWTPGGSLLKDRERKQGRNIGIYMRKICTRVYTKYQLHYLCRYYSKYGINT